MNNENYGDSDSRLVGTHPVTNEDYVYYPERNIGTKLASATTYNVIKTKHPTKNYEYSCLTTKAVLIGDIDDLSFDWYDKVKYYPEIAFRFYMTFKGYRFFITNKFAPLTFSSNMHDSSMSFAKIHEIFTVFNCDPEYVNQCWGNKRYAARLTPKGNREENKVIELIYEDNRKDHLIDALHICAIHDGFCSNKQLIYKYNSLNEDIKKE